jgi:hypothetical protein
MFVCRGGRNRQSQSRSASADSLLVSHMDRETKLSRWLSSHGVSIDHLEPFDFPDTGRGLRASKTLKVHPNISHISIGCHLHTDRAKD